MMKLSKFQLALLSLLVIVGFLFDSLVEYKMPLVLIGYVLIFIGGRAFGTLIYKERHQ